MAILLATSILFNMNQTIQEAATFQASDVTDSYFSKWPTDNRFISVIDQQFEPKSSLQVIPNPYFLDVILRISFKGCQTDSVRLARSLRAICLLDEPTPFDIEHSNDPE